MRYFTTLWRVLAKAFRTIVAKMPDNEDSCPPVLRTRTANERDEAIAEYNCPDCGGTGGIWVHGFSDWGGNGDQPCARCLAHGCPKAVALQQRRKSRIAKSVARDTERQQ